MSPLDPLNEIGYMPPPSNLEDQIQLTPTIFGAPKKRSLIACLAISSQVCISNRFGSYTTLE